MQQYTAHYFIEFFTSIPEVKWTVGIYEDHLKRKCALGHCNEFSIPGRDGSKSTQELVIETEMSKSLKELFNNYLKIEVWSVNDKSSFKFPQISPKQRILAALHEIQKLQK